MPRCTCSSVKSPRGTEPLIAGGALEGPGRRHFQFNVMVNGGTKPRVLSGVGLVRGYAATLTGAPVAWHVKVVIDEAKVNGGYKKLLAVTGEVASLPSPADQ